MKKKTLNDSKMEDLKDIVDHEGVKVIIDILEIAVAGLEKDVLTCDLNTQSFSNIALKLAQVQGAKKLINKLIAELTRVRGEDNGRN